MADPILGATVQVLLEKALSLADVRIGLVLGFKKDLKKLERSVKMIQAFLADAEDKQTGSRALRLWLEGLKEVAFDAYIVLDELNYEFLRRKVKSKNQLQGKVCSFSFFTKDYLSFRWRMASKVRDINIKLQNIEQDAKRVGLEQLAPQLLAPTTAVPPSREADTVAAPYVVGRDNDESEIVARLLSLSEIPVSVLPIVGMGGLGKTTLARSIHNNQQIRDHFNERIWVCVSKKVEVAELFKLILGSFTGNRVEFSSREYVVQEIQKKLEGKRYLLVLDDVWDERLEFWNDFFDSLMGISRAHGSKCLVTTRLKNVASIVSPNHPPCELRKLTDDECFSIITKKVVPSGEIPEELIRIKEHVIKRCDGLPLAAKLIGSLLVLQREKWPMIVKSWRSNLSKGPENDGIMQTLKLSFDYLPSPSIKKCFAYCSLFSKDARIDKDLLIELWMAEGFLQTNLPDTMEERGGEYHDILVQSSLLEKLGCRNYYSMHDLVHDLAQSLSKLQSFDSENDATKNCTYQVRYLALDPSAEIMSSNDTSALILKRSSISNEMLMKFKYLHTLNLWQANITELPSSIGKLKHLRFLAISSYEIRSLPESVCKLYNLQTLRMDYCHTLDVLPQGMNNLISLRHLHFRRIAAFKMPLEMGRLTSLQTLEFFNVGDELGRHIDELGPLKLLKGKLEIRNLELVKGKAGAERAELSGKQNLRELKFCWGWGFRPDFEISNDENVLDGLKPPKNLEVLTIQNFNGNRLPDWLPTLSELVKLELKGCDKCRELPTLGHLPSLENLVLEMENVSCIGASFYGLDDGRGGLGSTSSFGDGQVAVSIKKLFPALKNLELKSMKSLVEWEAAAVNDDVGLFPVLENLTIESGSLISAPTHFPSLKRLNINGNVQALAVKNILSKVTSSLEYLSLKGLDGFTSLCDLHAGPTGTPNSHFTSLKEFRVIACEGLVSMAKEPLEGCTSLWALEVSDCPNLISFPLDLQRTHPLSPIKSLRIHGNVQDLAVKNILSTVTGTLESLSLEGLDGLTSLCDLHVGPTGTANSYFTSIKKFRVRACKRLISIARETVEGCTSLSSLKVSDCPNLISFPLDLQQTPSLSNFSLAKCPKLFTDKNGMPRGFGRLTSLRHLSIGPFSTDDCSMELFDWCGLISCSSILRSLSLYGSPHMESAMPAEFQHFTALEYLYLFEFGSIEALPDWLGDLTSLEELWLCNCEKLRYLPSMPALRRLTKLRSVHVFNCPLLKESCCSNSGPNSEWSKKISQLPNLKIEILQH